MERRIAAVTGAAGGMGQAITARLLADGLLVAGLDLNADGLAAMARRHREDFLPCPADITEPEAVTAAFGQIDGHWGRLDALVNNAGTCFMSEFPNIPAEEFDRQMRVNFYSAFHC